MAQPPKYEREIDFTERDGDDTDHSGLNQELDAAAQSINGVRVNLALLQRDDGKLADDTVTPESLTDEAIAFIRGDLGGAVDQAQEFAQQSLVAASNASASAATSSSAAASASTSANAAHVNAVAAQQAAEEAANIAGMVPGDFVPRVGGVAMTGPLEVPAGAAGAQVPRAQEVVRLVGGAARIPYWADGAQPVAPVVGDTGFNTTRGTVETWSGAAWVPAGLGGAAVATLLGTAVDITGIPGYARHIDVLISDYSANDTNGLLMQLGTAGGVMTSGYSRGSASIVGASQAGIGPLQGLPMFINSAAAGMDISITLRSMDGNEWFVAGISGFTGQNNGVGHVRASLGAPLTTIRFTKYTGGSADGGTVRVLWRA